MKIKLLIIFSLFLVSCKKNNKIFVPQEIIELNVVDKIDLLENDFVTPMYLNRVLSNFVVYDDNSEGDNIKIFDNKGVVKFSFGKIGRGENEYIDISSLNVYDSHIGIYDFTNKTFRENYIKADTVISKKLWKTNLNIDVVNQLSKDRYICSTIYDSTRLYLLNKKGEIVSKSSIFPPKKNEVSLLTHSMACSGIIAVSKDKKHFASSVAYDGGVELYSVIDDEIKLEWRFSNFDMEYDVNKAYNDTPMPNEYSRSGYLSLSFNNEFLYALYSGGKMTEESGMSGNEIHVFDLKGKHKYKYILDQKVEEILIINNKSLVCLSSNENGSFLLYYEL